MRQSCLSVCGLLVIASLAAAQDNREPGRGPGFRMGFDGPGGPRNSLVTLASMPEVQRELALEESTRTKITALGDEQRGQMRQAFEGFDFQAFQDLSQEEREKRQAELRKRGDESNQRLDEKLREMLDARQLARLNQLQLQRQGAAAFERAEIRQRLALSQDQQEKIAGLIEKSRPTPGGFGPPDRGQRDRPAVSELLALLTDAQRTKWNDLTGPAFVFPETGPGFGPGFGPPGGSERKVLAQFDKNSDGWLNAEERKVARAEMPADRARGGMGGPRGPGGPPGGFGRAKREPAKPGLQVSPGDVAPINDAPLYDPSVLRTLFIEFENADWEAELADFHNTDVEVPATLMVDGQKYPQVGIHFRGMSSYGMVPAGYKRSLNVEIDFIHSKQRLYGYKTLNLLNAHEDASFLSTVLYSHIARQHIPAPRANFVRVVINGESWGVYVNVQQFNKEFLAENYDTTKGARWKVSGSPGGGGGLEYVGEDLANYKRRYEIKSADNEKSWRALVKLCKTLNETPAEELEAALAPMLDLDGLLWFLALDVTLANGDGYWTRASDYSLYLDGKGKFHVIPHDMNEAFRGGGPGMAGGPGGFGPFGGAPEGRPPENRNRDARPPQTPEGRPGQRPAEGLGPDGRGPGGPRMGGGGGIELDPLVALNDNRKPLRSKVLAVPSLRTRYLEHVRTLAGEDLDWNKLGPVVAQFRQLIESEVQADTRKLESFEAFQRFTSPEPAPGARGRELPLRSFADQRRAFLLNYQERRAE